MSIDTALSNKLQTSFSYGEHTVTLTTDYLAKQANSSVLIQMGDTCVHVAITTNPSQEGTDFLPLMVSAVRRHYANGQIAGGYIKRETTRGTEEEILLSRLIDRAIRPLFPKGFNDEINIICYIMSVDPNVSPDIPCFLAVGAALSISDLPFTDIVSAVKIGQIDGNFAINPSTTALEQSSLNLFLAGKNAPNKDGILMIEAGAKEITEETAVDAIPFGMEAMTQSLEGIQAFQDAYKAKHVNFAKRSNPEPKDLSDLIALLKDEVNAYCSTGYAIPQKVLRSKTLKNNRKELVEKYAETHDPVDLYEVTGSLEKLWVRDYMFSNKKRIDHRDFTTVRPISIEHSVLPRVHGDCLFQRGETQSYVACTLAPVGKGENFETIGGDEHKRDFLLYYNFPPYCVGEVGRMGPPKRREIGHGNLARRALLNVIPNQDDFPYTIRIVSETMESNGSSSMATVCGATLSMMSAGVPITKPVAGIAMGMLKENDDICILSDILGDEDHIGDMDLKVAGTESGITALQMDIKIDGITQAMLTKALLQAKEGRLHILGEMNKALSKPQAVSQYAPRMVNFNIKTEKIKDVIGKGGSVIREIIEKFGVEIDITDDGKVTVSSVDGTAAEECKQYIVELIKEIEVGQVYEGPITRILDFGAVVSLGNNKDGFLHISQISSQRINDINDVLQMNQVVKVKVTEVDRNNKVKLSMKEFDSGAES